MTRALVLALMALAALLASPAAIAGEAPADVLRICADPDNLPQSRADGSGFENQIARVLAQELGVALQYAWLPDRRGFVRKTMGAGLCDVLVGVPVGFERAELTAPYYRSSYVWLQRAEAGPAPTGFDDPRLARWRIGVQLIGNDMAMSPPAVALARHVPGARVVGFPIAGEQPAAERIVAALAAGDLDGALVWGPQAGFFAQRSPVPLAVARLAPPADQPAAQRFDFAIAVGVRKGEDDLRDRLQAALLRRHADIERILAQYGVPLAGETP